MKLPFQGRRAEDLPARIATAMRGVDGGRLLSAAPDADSQAWLVASQYVLTLVDLGRGSQGPEGPEGTAGTAGTAGTEALVWSRPWHDMDAGSWSRESAMLTVTWVDRSRPGQWRLGDSERERRFLATLRERVQATVVLAEELNLSGRRTGRAVIRQDLRTRELVEQVVLGRGVMADDEVSAASARALDWLREQVGLPRI